MTDRTVHSIDGVPIRYSVTGAGEPAVVLLHGWAMDRRIWDGQVPRLAEPYRVVAVDLAGHGESGSGRADWTMGAFAEDVRAVVDALGLSRVVLVGHSMSGLVALEVWMLLPTTAPAVTNEVLRRVTAMPPAISIAVLRHAMTHDARPALREFRAPIVAVNGDRFPTNLEAARRYAPQFDLIVMPGVSHYTMLDDPDRFTRLLEEAIGRVVG